MPTQTHPATPPIPKPRRLVCACCGAETRGRQWWNRDTGYGVCPACFASCVMREGIDAAISNYGHPGINHSLDVPGANSPASDAQPSESLNTHV